MKTVINFQVLSSCLSNLVSQEGLYSTYSMQQVREPLQKCFMHMHLTNMTEPTCNSVFYSCSTMFSNSEWAHKNICHRYNHLWQKSVQSELVRGSPIITDIATCGE